VLKNKHGGTEDAQRFLITFKSFHTMRITQTFVNEISYKIIGCAIEVHKQLGPGLLESVYHKCMLE
jgi:hypothetical protein